jgi:hypothetical protein
LRAKSLGNKGIEDTDAVAQVERFAALLKEGLITQAEFDRQKGKLLGE